MLENEGKEMMEIGSPSSDTLATLQEHNSIVVIIDRVEVEKGTCDNETKRGFEVVGGSAQLVPLSCTEQSTVQPCSSPLIQTPSVSAILPSTIQPTSDVPLAINVLSNQSVPAVLPCTIQSVPAVLPCSIQSVPAVLPCTIQSVPSVLPCTIQSVPAVLPCTIQSVPAVLSCTNKSLSCLLTNNLPEPPENPQNIFPPFSNSFPPYPHGQVSGGQTVQPSNSAVVMYSTDVRQFSQGASNTRPLLTKGESFYLDEP